MNEDEKKKTNLSTKEIRKANVIIYRTILEYINNLIYIKYEGEIGKGLFVKKLKYIGAFEKAIIDVKSLSCYLVKTLKEIFSRNLPKKYTNYPEDYNKKLIDSLLNEKNEDKKNFFNDLFNMTFLDFIKKLSDPDKNLREKFEKILRERIFDENELNKIENIINNYEIKILGRKIKKQEKKVKLHHF